MTSIRNRHNQLVHIFKYHRESLTAVDLFVEKLQNRLNFAPWVRASRAFQHMNIHVGHIFAHSTVARYLELDLLIRGSKCMIWVDVHNPIRVKQMSFYIRLTRICISFTQQPNGIF